MHFFKKMSSSSNSSRSSRIGYRFHPTDEEAITFLTDKVLGRDSVVQDLIAVLGDICNYEPWELPGLSSLDSADREWYFLCTLNYKYKNSKRVNRTTRAGYWKVTGNHRKIKSRNGTIIGEKKTLVFYEGSIRKRNGKRTSWVIHEYHLPNQEEWVVLCKLKKKDGDAADAPIDGSLQPSYESPNTAFVEDINADEISIDDLGDIDELYEMCRCFFPEPDEMQLQLQEKQQQPASSSGISPSFHGSGSNSAQNHYCSSWGVNNEGENESWLSYLEGVLPQSLP